jgi:hypothetical protein
MQEHIRMGEALKPLRDQGVLVVGSGSSYHNVPAMMRATVAGGSKGHVAGQVRESGWSQVREWIGLGDGEGAAALLPTCASSCPCQQVWCGTRQTATPLGVRSLLQPAFNARACSSRPTARSVIAGLSLPFTLTSHRTRAPLLTRTLHLRRPSPLSSRHSPQRFDDWLADACTRRTGADRAAQLSRWASAPGAAEAHPRAEHLMPLLVAAGAGGGDAGWADRVVAMGGVALSSFVFGWQQPAAVA